MNAAIRIAVAGIAKRLRGIPVTFVDEVSDPKEHHGAYVSLELRCEGVVEHVIVLTTEGFYENLGKVMNAALPASTGKKLS